MKCCLRIILGAILAIQLGYAQTAPIHDDPASKQDVERLMAAVHVRDRIKLIMESSRKQTKTMFDEILHKELPEATPDELVQMQGMIEDMIDDIEKDYPIDAVMQDMIPVYQRHLTRSDCEGIIAFYSSSLGQKVLRELPAVTSEAMQVSNSHLQPRMEAAITRLKDRVIHMAEEDQEKKNTETTKPAPK
jgi:hypothetical protein